jgi:hypothetical protein
VGGRQGDGDDRPGDPRHRVAPTVFESQMQSEIASAYEQLRKPTSTPREQARRVAATLRIGCYTPISAGR